MKNYAHERKVAMETLRTFDPEKVKLVSSCRDMMLSAAANEDYISRVSNIKRDYMCQAAEDWDELSVEEAADLFEEILSTLDIIHIADAMAYC